jgi:hypothetical protein
MTPKEKAIELYNKFYNTSSHPHHVESRKNNAKQYTLIAVDEIIKAVDNPDETYLMKDDVNYWKEVKKEIELL